jgi:hypothetical protein
MGAIVLLISPSYGPFSLGARFETYEPYISLVFKFFSERSKPLITENKDTESVDTGARLYLVYSLHAILVPRK